MLRLAWPHALGALLLVPLALAGLLVIARRRERAAVRFTNIEVLAAIPVGSRPFRSLLPPALAAVALTSSVVALARPERRVDVVRPASVVLTVDTSGSMAAVDVRPTRLAAAESAIWRFLADLPAIDRVGLVTFSDEPMIASPLTLDRDLVATSLQTAQAPGEGTAIGDALVRSVWLLGTQASTTGASAILLLSDGAQTVGSVGPLAGASRAALAGIPVYAVALGTPHGVITQGVMSLHVPPDAPTLRSIARATGGQFFAPTTRARLDAVYAQLAHRLGRTTTWREISSWLLGLAAISALLAVLLSQRWAERLP